MMNWDPFADPAEGSAGDAAGAVAVEAVPAAAAAAEEPSQVWDNPFGDPALTKQAKADIAERSALRRSEAEKQVLAEQRAQPSVAAWLKGGNRDRPKAEPIPDFRDALLAAQKLAIKDGDPIAWRGGLPPVGPPEVVVPLVELAEDGWVICDGEEVPEEARGEVLEVLTGLQPLRLSLRGGSMRHPELGGFAPICHLGECGLSTCSTSRVVNPDARARFVDFAAGWVVEAVGGANPEEIAYVSLGSGELLADFEIIERLRVLGKNVGQVHLVDPLYEPRVCTGAAPARLALAQFATWFSSLLVYAHPSLDSFAVRCRRSETRPHTVMLIDCVELSSRWEDEVKPVLEEVMAYGGVFLTLKGSGHAVQASAADLMPQATGEAWRLEESSGRMRLVDSTSWHIAYDPDKWRV